MAITGSMKAAYCVVAANCSVRFLGVTVSEQRKDELETVIWDVDVLKKLLEKNTQNHALLMVKAYLEDACTRGEIIDIKGLSSDEPYSEYDTLPTPEVDKVQETFKSSSLELLAIIMDPLPDVLLWAEVVVSDMARKN
ncbi:hypothetical protein WN944_022991 [Citrus x changshan-huyou]|uniref:Uncharacterized protein n=1 Tax=Citrus x changshan-huyou TaxID=2935761 RepID=A0AAP0R0T2_9ROSI